MDSLGLKGCLGKTASTNNTRDRGSEKDNNTKERKAILNLLILNQLNLSMYVHLNHY